VEGRSNVFIVIRKPLENWNYCFYCNIYLRSAYKQYEGELVLTPICLHCFQSSGLTSSPPPEMTEEWWEEILKDEEYV